MVRSRVLNVEIVRVHMILDIRVVTWYMGSELKAQNMTGIRAQRKGLRAQGLEGSDQGSQGFWAPNQGSDLSHGLKISHHNIFPHNKVSVHRIFWPRYISYSCFLLAAVPVVRSRGIIFLIYLIVEGTVIWISSHFSRFVTQLLNALYLEYWNFFG